MMSEKTMRLLLLLPTQVIVDRSVRKVIAEAENGYFCILPRHIDFVAALVPSIFYFMSDSQEEQFYAIRQGTLVKCGEQVRVSTFEAIHSDNLNKLQDAIIKDFVTMDEHESSARSALARLEAGTIRRFMELEERRHV